MLGEWLQEEPIGASVVRARARSKHADDKHEDVTSLWICFELTTERQTVQLRDQDLAEHEIGLERAHLGQRFVPIRCELDTMAGLGEEVSGERPNVGFTVDEKDREPVGRQRRTLDDPRSLRKG